MASCYWPTIAYWTKMGFCLSDLCSYSSIKTISILPSALNDRICNVMWMRPHDASGPHNIIYNPVLRLNLLIAIQWCWFSFFVNPWYHSFTCPKKLDAGHEEVKGTWQPTLIHDVRVNIVTVICLIDKHRAGILFCNKRFAVPSRQKFKLPTSSSYSQAVHYACFCP